MQFPFGKLVIGIIAVATVTYGVAEFRGPNGYQGLMQKREQVRTLQQENTRLREDNAKLEQRVDRLRHDPNAQELEIRKRLGLVKPGETVYVLQEKPKAQAAAAGAR